MSIGLQIELEKIDQKVIVRLDGRLDASSAPLLEKRLNPLVDEKLSMLLLDFSRVDYLSSAGMRVLLSMTKKMDAKGGVLVLFSVGEEALEIIKIAGFDRILHLLAGEKEALQFQIKTP